MGHRSSGSHYKLYFNVNCTQPYTTFYTSFHSTKSKFWLLSLFWTTTWLTGFVFSWQEGKNKFYMLSPTAIIFCKEDHRRNTCFHRIVSLCFSQLSFDKKAPTALMSMLIQLLKTFLSVFSVESALKMNTDKRAHYG